MSEPVTKQRPTVDLDDFERRLREQAHHHDDDPLAELARLVGDRHDPYGDVFAREAVAAPAAYQPEHHDYDRGRQEPDFGYQPPVAPRLAGDFAAIEAGLRGTVSDHAEAPRQHPASAAAALPFAQPTYRDERAYQGEHAYHDDQGRGDAYAAGNGYDEADWAPAGRAVPPQVRSRRPVFIMAATIAVGVIGVGAAFALKGHSSSPGEIKTIMAAAGPTKIQPPADAPSDATSQDSALLGKTNQATPTKLANREEQPVDLAQTVQQNAARDAASVPVPLSPGQQQDAMNANPGSAISDQGFNITPKKVKSISVRPDGTILPNDQPPAAAMPIPHAPKVAEHPAAPVAKASTPKTTSRVVLTTPKPTQTAETDTTPKPTTTPKSVKKVKPQPQRVATAETNDQEVTAAPAAETESAGSGGGFAVQLAAPGSEAEAKSVSSKLGAKFASALSGHRLGFHKADSKGKSVYRVRVGSLSKEDAVSLCEKLKADGGTCFVAKN